MKGLCFKTASVILLLGGPALLSSCGSKDSSGPETEKMAQVVARRVKIGDITRTLTVTGDIRPMVQVTVSAKVPGHITRLEVSEGDMVTDGDVVVEIDSAAARAALKQVEAAVTVAEASLKQAGVVLKNAEREKTRVERLFKEGSVSEQVRDHAVTAFEKAAAGRELAVASLKQAEAALESARVHLSEHSLVAGLRGVVAKKFVEQGDMVSPGSPVLTLMDTEKVKIVVGVPSRESALIEPGKTLAVISVDASTEAQRTVSVTKLAPIVESGTRTVSAEIHIDNTDGALKPGMFARVQLHLDIHKEAVLIPRNALVTREGESCVYVVEDGKARIRKVALGLSEGGLVEVVEGLTGEETIVVGGLAGLRGETETRVRVGKK